MPKLIDHDERRREIGEAAWRVILRDGIGRASVRSVAAEAGLSTGSLRHVFVTQAELLAFAMQLVIDRVTERMQALTMKETIRASVEDAAAQFLPLDAERRAEMEVYSVLVAAAMTSPALMRLRDTANAGVFQACHGMIDALAGEAASDNVVSAIDDVELEAHRLHALIDGLAAHVIQQPVHADTTWSLRVLGRHLDSLES